MIREALCCRKGFTGINGRERVSFKRSRKAWRSTEERRNKRSAECCLCEERSYRNENSAMDCQKALKSEEGVIRVKIEGREEEEEEEEGEMMKSIITKAVSSPYLKLNVEFISARRPALLFSFARSNVPRYSSHAGKNRCWIPGAAAGTVMGEMAWILFRATEQQQQEQDNNAKLRVTTGSDLNQI